MDSTKANGLAAVSAVCGLGLIIACGLAPSTSMAATVTVTPTSMGDWTFVDRGPPTYEPGTNPSGVGQLVNGPSSPPAGTGSAQLGTDNNVLPVAGEELRNTGFAGTALADITSLSYWTYDTSNNGSQFPYLTIGVSTTGGSVANDYIAFEPPYQTPSYNPSLPDQGSPVLNQWQSWNAFIGGWWSNNGLAGCGPGANVCSLHDYLTAFPNATIANEASGLGAIRFAVGYTSGSTDVFNGYVDDFTIGVNGTNTTYNFEAAATTPLPAALPLFGTGLGLVGGIVGLRKRRKRLAKAAA